MTRHRLSRRSFVAALASAAAVRAQATPEIVLRYDFNRDSAGWLPGFTDYSLQTGDLRRIAEIRPLPPEINPNLRGYYLQGMNRSDDLFMFLKKELDSADGLEPNRLYSVTIDIELLSNAQSGCIGVGGAPGESVYLKAGVSRFEPLAVLDRGTEVVLSVDKGNQAVGGRDIGLVGNIANGTPCGADPSSPYVYLHRVYQHPLLVSTDERAVLWALVGTDSGFEGLTGIYYYSIQVTLRPLRT